ncbi:hypothetical protein ACHAXS_000008, partial [Conticribra weissflogii]
MIADGDKGYPIMWRMKRQEGKERPKKSDGSWTGFCVSDGILAMHSVSVYGQGLVKKRGMYWPKDVPGDYIDECFKQKELGEHDCYVQEIDGVPFLVHCHKEDKYV